MRPRPGGRPDVGVYTQLDRAEIAEFLRDYDVGELLAQHPVGPGIENTTYLLETSLEGRSTRYVLTVFERDPLPRVQEVAALVSELARRGVPSAPPIPAAATGRAVGRLRDKPATLVRFVDGRVVEKPAIRHLEALGRAVANLHLSAGELQVSAPGAQLAEILCPLARDLAGQIRARQPTLAELLLREADDQEALPQADLPSGLVHADLFLDNVIFDGDDGRPEVRALLDFQLVGRGPWLFDLAVVLLDAAWVGRSIGGDLTRAFLGAYRALRPLQADEVPNLLPYVRRAALRFLCLRIQRFILSDAALASGRGKNPWDLASRLEILRAG